MKPRILVIDDEVAIRDSLRMILEYEGYEFLGAATGQDGLSVLGRETVDLVFLDIKMPGMDGLEVLQRIKASNDTLRSSWCRGTRRCRRPSRPQNWGPSTSSRSRLRASACS